MRCRAPCQLGFMVLPSSTFCFLLQSDHSHPFFLACVAGVQRGGRGEVKFEREVRSLGSGRDSSQIPTIALPALLALPALEFNFPLSPLCTPATQATFILFTVMLCENVSFSCLTFYFSGKNRLRLPRI